MSRLSRSVPCLVALVAAPLAALAQPAAVPGAVPGAAAAPPAPQAASAAPGGSASPAAGALVIKPRAEASRTRLADHIVAIVGGELVTSVEVQQRAARLAAEQRQRNQPVPGASVLQDQALESLIDERTMVAHAKDVGVRIDESELDRAEATIAGQNQMRVPAFRERLKAEGSDWKQFRASLRDQLMVERIRDREVPPRIRITDAEVDQWLAQERSRGGREPQLEIAQIVVPRPEGADAQALQQAQQRAEGLLARARAGEDFAALVREAGGERAGTEPGGSLGLKPASRLPDSFVAAVRDVAPGQVAPAVLSTAAGFHVLKLVKHDVQDGTTLTQTHARHILLRVPPGSAAADVQARAQKLLDVRRQIERQEKSFEAAARELSEDGSAANGGDLGWAGPGQFVPEFEEPLNKLGIGELSQPIVTRFGVHLVQPIERREVKVTPLQMREQALAQLREAKYEDAFTEWLKELRMRAYIERREAP